MNIFSAIAGIFGKKKKETKRIPIARTYGRSVKETTSTYTPRRHEEETDGYGLTDPLNPFNPLFYATNNTDDNSASSPSVEFGGGSFSGGGAGGDWSSNSDSGSSSSYDSGSSDSGSSYDSSSSDSGSSFSD